MNTRIGSGLVIALLASQAGAQFFTPPPAKPLNLAPPIYIPPAVPKAKADALLQQNKDRINREKEQRRIDLEEQSKLPPLPYESLVTMGDDGKFVRLSGDPHIEALKRNPMLSDDVRAEALAFAMDRAARIEQLVIDRLDEVVRLDELLSAELNIAAAPEVRQIQRSLGVNSSLTRELENRGTLTIVQAKFNDRIVSEYDDAIKLEVLGSSPAMMDEVQFVARRGVRDPLDAYHALLATAARDISVVVAETGLDGGLSAELIESVTSHAPTASDAELASAMAAAMKSLSLEQQKAILQVARDIRASGE